MARIVRLFSVGKCLFPWVNRIHESIWSSDVTCYLFWNNILTHEEANYYCLTPQPFVLLSFYTSYFLKIAHSIYTFDESIITILWILHSHTYPQTGCMQFSLVHRLGSKNYRCVNLNTDYLLHIHIVHVVIM